MKDCLAAPIRDDLILVFTIVVHGNFINFVDRDDAGQYSVVHSSIFCNVGCFALEPCFEIHWLRHTQVRNILQMSQIQERSKQL